MRTTLILVLVAVVAVLAFIFLTPPSRRPAAANLSLTDAPSNGPVEIPFVQGGTVAMQLQGADYHIVPSPDDRITISYQANQFTGGKPRISTGAKGSEAHLRIETPSSSGIRVEIALPVKTNLYARLTAGNLDIQGIEGSKDCEASAGNLVVDVVNARQYGPVYASVSSGNLSANAWSTHKGGLMRSFKTNGPGPYGLRAHVGAGNLTLTERTDIK